MRIISKFHDYYDTATAYGIDKECIYKRIAETPDISKHIKYATNSEEYKKLNQTDFNIKKTGIDCSLIQHVVGFCGEIYPLMELKKENLKWYPKIGITREYKSLYFYDKDELKQHLHEWGCENPDKIIIKASNWWSYILDNDCFFDKQNWRFLPPLFRQHGCPVFAYTYLCGNTTLELNACLKNFEFYKIKSATEAFQEIHMYMSGVLGNIEKETLDISDKDMRDKKGFDNWSFKKEPGQKKRRKKKN